MYRFFCFLPLVVVFACVDPATECPVGSSGCECTEGGACDEALTCEQGVCLEAEIAPLALDDGGAGTLDGGPEDGGGNIVDPGLQIGDACDPDATDDPCGTRAWCPRSTEVCEQAALLYETCSNELRCDPEEGNGRLTCIGVGSRIECRELCTILEDGSNDCPDPSHTCRPQHTGATTGYCLTACNADYDCQSDESCDNILGVDACA